MYPIATFPDPRHGTLRTFEWSTNRMLVESTRCGRRQSGHRPRNFFSRCGGGAIGPGSLPRPSAAGFRPRPVAPARRGAVAASVVVVVRPCNCRPTGSRRTAASAPRALVGSCAATCRRPPGAAGVAGTTGGAAGKSTFLAACDGPWHCVRLLVRCIRNFSDVGCTGDTTPHLGHRARGWEATMTKH